MSMHWVPEAPGLAPIRMFCPECSEGKAWTYDSEEGQRKAIREALQYAYGHDVVRHDKERHERVEALQPLPKLDKAEQGVLF